MAVCPLGLPLDSPIPDAETLNPSIEHETLKTLNDEIETLNLLDGSDGPEEDAEPPEKAPEEDEECSVNLNPLTEHEALKTLNDEIETLDLLDGSEGPEEDVEPSEKTPEEDEECSMNLNPSIEHETLNDEIETLNLSDGSEEPEEDAEPPEKVPEGGGECGGGFPYPLRPGEPDCDHYVRTGGCSYGAGCRFNHPPDKIKTKVKVRKSAEPEQGGEEKEEETSSEMGAQTESKSITMELGGCSFVE